MARDPRPDSECPEGTEREGDRAVHGRFGNYDTIFPKHHNDNMHQDFNIY